MRILTALSLTLVMTACGESAPTETVESLVANPERLKELREQCRADRAKLGDELCNAVAEATRQRFMGDGDVPIRRRRKNRSSDSALRAKKFHPIAPHAAARCRSRRFSCIRSRDQYCVFASNCADNSL